MKKNIIFILCTFLFTSQLSIAQNNAEAEKAIINLLNSAKTSAIKTGFKLSTSDKNGSHTAVGTFTLKGSKFLLEMDGMKVWFDGKTQWAYNQQNNEVSVTEPSEKELSETNPMVILSAFKSKCTIRFSTKTKSAQNQCIEMLPKIANKDISKIEVQIVKANGNLFSIKLTNKNGGSSVLTLNNFQKGVKITDNNFTFNASKFKEVNINDLR